MKTIKLTVLLLFFPLVFFAQTLTGLWTGTLTNDSSTIRRDQSFEIVLTQYKEKVYGYSRMTFFVHDTLYYIVKRVKGTIEGEVCEVKDDDIIKHNFPRKPEKGVKLVSIFRRNKQDSLWYLEGDWKTTESKKYYSISGKMSLKPETDPEKSKLIPHLEELKLADDVAFYKASKKVAEPVATNSQPVKDKPKGTLIKEEKPVAIPIKETKTEVAAQTKQPEIKEKPIIADTKDFKKDNIAVVPIKSEPVATINQPVKDKPKETIVKEEKPVAIPIKETKTETVAQIKQPTNDLKKEQPIIEEKKIATSPKNNKKDSLVIVQAKSNPVIPTNQPVNDSKKQPDIKEIKQEPKKSEPIVITKPVEQKKEPVVETIKPEIKNKEVASVAAANDKQQPVSLFAETKPVIAPTAAVFVAERKTTPPQIVNFTSDSLELALYDNGEVDGDTVSVLLNGEIILAKQGLKVSAIKKTIYVPAGKSDSLTLVLYAENLGKYPPNTGLLVVHDGEDTYQIRFSADLQQNAAVIFKRKRN
jgi:hypothetical protein